MRGGAVILGRMDSSRLPGKVLRPVAGVPLALWIARRCQQVPEFADRVILATTTRSVDDPLAETANYAGLPVFRGSCEDVAGRALEAAQTFQLDYFARINGDSPLVDAHLLSQGVQLLLDANVDFVTNLMPRTYPYGVAVEIVRTATFRRMYTRLESASDREHVMGYLYRHLDELDWMACPPCVPNLSDLRLTVDTQDDWQRLQSHLADFARAPETITFRDIAQPLVGVSA